MKTIFFTGDIKLVNKGYNNKIIDVSTNEIIEEITDTIQGAIKYVQDEYGVYIK